MICSECLISHRIGENSSGNFLIRWNYFELEDEGMEFMDGICKTRECAWDVLTF